MILFENFKSFLQLVVSDTQTVSQNAVLADTAYAKAVDDHISALTPDQNIRLDSTLVTTGGATGLLVNDELKREIRFEWKGAERLQGWVRPLFQNQGNIGSKFNKIWVRSDDAAGTVTTIPYGTLTDGRRYYVTDQDHGVFYLNEFGQVLGAIPGFSASPAVIPDYGAPSSAITFTVAAVEYVGIVNETDHILNIYDTATFTLAASFGTSGTPGLPDAGDLLDTPVDLAVDDTNSILYIACQGGTPPGSSALGFVASFDLTPLPAIPTFTSFVAVNTGDGTLPQAEITTPRGLQYDPTLGALWILNDLTLSTGSPYPVGFPYMEAGALSVSVTGTSNGFLDAHIDGRTEDYWLRQQDTKLHLDNDRRKLYIGNMGGVEVFDLTTLKHQLHFGYLSGDTSLVAGTSPILPSVTFPSVNDAGSVASDILSVDGALRNLVLFTDGTNNRFVRVPEDAYLGANIVTFSEMTFTVPLSLHGYLVKGTLATSKIRIEFRTVSAGVWQRLDQTDSVPASLFFQFRVRVTPDLIDIIDEKAIKEIVIVGEQE